MEALLRDEFIQRSPALLLPYLILVAVLTAMPLLRIYNAWLVEKMMSQWLAVLLIGAHLSIMGVLWHTRWLGLILLYLLALTLVALIAPLFGALADQLVIRQLSDRDIARYRYMLSLDPNDANALVGLANAYLKRGKRDEAIAAYEKARAIDPLHTGVASSRLQRLFDSRVCRSINTNGVKITSRNAKLLNMEAKVQFEVVSKDEEASIPEL